LNYIFIKTLFKLIYYYYNIMSLKVILLAIVVATASANILGEIKVDLDSPKIDAKTKY